MPSRAEHRRLVRVGLFLCMCHAMLMKELSHHSLTGVTVTTERMIFEHRISERLPTSVEEFVTAFKSSEIFANNEAELEVHLAAQAHRKRMTNDFKEAVSAEKARSVSKRSPYTVSFVPVQNLLKSDAHDRFFVI